MISAISFKNAGIVQQKNELKHVPAKLRLNSQPACDQINFGHRFHLVNISGLPCPYCGEIMITPAELKHFGVEISKSTGRELAKKLRIIQNKTQFPIESKIATELIQQSRQKPKMNAQELLESMLPWASKKLINKQQPILDKLPEIIDKLTEETKRTALENLADIQERIKHPVSKHLFKKKTAVRTYVELLKEEKSKNANNPNIPFLIKIVETLNTLPTSENNIEAFIVKYSRRSPREIGERLLEPSLSSVEHIEPESLGGPSKPSNYLVAHKDCNGKRKRKAFDEFIREIPSITKHMTKYFEVVIRKINSYETYGHKDYPNLVMDTLREQSKGALDIRLGHFPQDITLDGLFESLKIKEAKKPQEHHNNFWQHSIPQERKRRLTKRAKTIQETQKLLRRLEEESPPQVPNPPQKSTTKFQRINNVPTEPTKPKYTSQFRDDKTPLIRKPAPKIKTGTISQELLEEAMEKRKTGNIRQLKKQIQREQRNKSAQKGN